MRSALITFLLVPVLLAVGLTACGGDDEPSDQAATPEETATASPDGGEAAEGGESAEAPTEIVGGQTVLDLDEDLVGALEAVQGEVRGTGQAEQVPTGIALPITGGELDIDTPSGTVEHEGGLEFEALGQRVTADDLVLDVDGETVTAVIGGERMPLLSADVGTPEVPQTGDTIMLPLDVSIGDQAAESLNEDLGIDVFSGGLRLGELTVNAERP